MRPAIDMMRVSAVIPTYNCAPFIAEAISSALAQTYPLTDIIVVDDGSSDETEAAVSPFKDRITYIRTERRGVGSARNTGLDLATGDVVAFLDGDDAWYPQKTALQVKALEATPDVIGVATDFTRTDIAGRTMMNDAILTEYPIFRTYELDWRKIFPRATEIDGVRMYYGPCFPSLFCGNFIKTSTLMVRRGRERYPDGFKTQEDYRYFLDLALAGSLAHLETSTLAYRRRPGQISDRAHARRIAEDSTDAVVDYLPQARKLMPRSLMNRRLADRHLQTGVVRLAEDDRGGARASFWESLRARPSAYAGALYGLAWLPPFVTARLREATTKAGTIEESASYSGPRSRES
jgi:glycosyltransferase involved in cell wall biosynthesis